MRYVGGKVRISKWVLEQILSVKGSRTKYLEPFLGAGSVFERAAPYFDNIMAGDSHPDLMLMWQALQNGWNPPDFVSREEYQKLRYSQPSALRGFVGFGSSFGGKWFGGYVDTVFDNHHLRMTKPYLKAAKNSVLKTAQSMKNADLRHCDYSKWHPDENTLIYCDPPYRSTLGYSGGSDFNTEDFFKIASEWSDAGALVLISEQSEYAGWTILAEKTRKSMLRVATEQENTMRRELILVKGSEREQAE